MPGRLYFLLLSFCGVVCGRLTTHLDALQQEYPPNHPFIPEITGPFIVTITVRFDNISGGAFQRMFDFGDGPDTNNIVFSQLHSGDGVRFEYWPDDGSTPKYTLDISGVLTAGTTDVWKVGIDATGLMTVKKNGSLVGSKPAAVPAPGVSRTNKLLGESNWPSDSPLEGAVLGLQVKNLWSTDSLLQQINLLNFPSQVLHPFVASAYVRFDNVTGRYYQRVFDFANGKKTDSVALSQKANTNTIYLEVWEQSEETETLQVVHQCYAENAIIEGEMALWRVEMNATGLYTIEKNGVVVSNSTSEGCFGNGLPRSIFRQDMFIGHSSWVNDDKLDGVILGLRVDSYDAS